MRAIDLTGKIFGRLTVVRRSWADKSVRAIWLCQCDCGKTSTVQSGNLRSGTSKSCGCSRGKAHGLTKHPLYSIWGAVRTRCSLRCDLRARHRYYGRGIRVCDEWQEDFMAFYVWATSHDWKPGLDNDGNYCPNNCRWVTRAVNCANKGKQKNNTSGYTGVVWHQSTEKWRAQIGHEGRVHPLGYFETKELALTARNEFIVENNLPHPIQTFRLASDE